MEDKTVWTKELLDSGMYYISYYQITVNSFFLRARESQLCFFFSFFKYQMNYYILKIVVLRITIYEMISFMKIITNECAICN